MLNNKILKKMSLKKDVGLREIFKLVIQIIRLEAPTKKNREIKSLAN